MAPSLFSRRYTPIHQDDVPVQELGAVERDESQIAFAVNHHSSLTRRLYTSHFLSTWNSRLFEFGAPLFLATIYPDTLLYASLYALLRSLSATLFSSRVGAYVDSTDRLQSIRLSIIAQRGAVILGCAVLLSVLLALRAASASDDDGSAAIDVFGGHHHHRRRLLLLLLGWTGFAASTLLACVEKLASIGNSVAVERDWVVVICESDGGFDRATLNASLRRIDLFCKLVAPLVVGLVHATTGTVGAITFVLGLSALSAVVEYVAIAQVYHSVPELSTRTRKQTTISPCVAPEEVEAEEGTFELHDTSHRNHNSARQHLAPQTTTTTTTTTTTARGILPLWHNYITSPVFPASLALSLLYLSVLSTGIHWQAYMLAVGYSPLLVSLLRVLAVTSELSATYLGPYLMQRIGPIRSGLWSINWQVACLVGTVMVFSYASLHTAGNVRDGTTVDGDANANANANANAKEAAAAAALLLTAGITASRLGLWAFDLSVQSLVQDATPPQNRAAFSSCEVALQNLFELLSFLGTIVFSRPQQFVYPAVGSCLAVVVAAACFAGYVRRERGHLLHWERMRCLHCLGLEKGRAGREEASS